MKTLFSLFKKLILVLLGLWIAGFILYMRTLESYEMTPPETNATDAIVVLTGDTGRVAEGLRLLADKKGRVLFISGVDKRVTTLRLLKKYKRYNTPQIRSKIELGYRAKNTIGNAREVAAWVRKREFHSLRLVTSHYHMPRSVLEFHHAMPEVFLIAHPVSSNLFQEHALESRFEQISQLVKEFNKLIGAKLRTTIARGGRPV